MNKEEVRKQVRQILEDRFNFSEQEGVCDADFLHHDLGMDSLDNVDFIKDLEQHYGFEIADHESRLIAQMTVGDVVNFVYGKLSK
ncbi:MAG: acyl carrier protein [Alphaproteobacteria bacterium]|nr:acyl carrier protein [Alphaproteobacteria bacterium]